MLSRVDGLTDVRLMVGDVDDAVHATRHGIHRGPSAQLPEHPSLRLDLHCHVSRLPWRPRPFADTPRWLEQRSRAEHPILVNGNAPFGYTGPCHFEPFGATDVTFFDHGSVHGTLGHLNDRPVTLVVQGVAMAIDRLPELGDPLLTGYLYCDELTIRGGQVVRDACFDRLLSSIRPVVDLMGLQPKRSRQPEQDEPLTAPRRNLRSRRARLSTDTTGRGTARPRES